MGCQGSGTFPVQGAAITPSLSPGHAVGASPSLLPGVPLPCSLPFPGHRPPSLHQPPRPTFATQLYTQLRNKLPLSHPAWPAWLRSVPKVAWAHVADGHLLLLLHGHHPGPQGSALLRAGVMALRSPRVSPAPCRGDGIAVPKGQPCSAPFSARNNCCPAAGPWHLGWSPARVGASGREPGGAAEGQPGPLSAGGCSLASASVPAQQESIFGPRRLERPLAR